MCLVAGAVVALGIDHKLVALQELVAHVDGGIQVAAPVVAQVHDQLGHALLLEALEGVHHLLVGLGTEARDAQVARTLVEHIAGVDAVYGDVVTRDAEGDQFRYARALHLDGDLGALLAAQALLDVAVAHLHAGDDRVVHIDDAVAGQHTHALAGPTGHRLDDVERVLVHVELDAHTAELTLERLLEFLGLLGVGIGRVGVQVLEHALDGVLDELVLVDRVHIQGRDGIFGIQQLLHRLGH